MKLISFVGGSGSLEHFSRVQDRNIISELSFSLHIVPFAAIEQNQKADCEGRLCADILPPCMLETQALLINCHYHDMQEESSTAGYMYVF
jgi:hypothetical protein